MNSLNEINRQLKEKELNFSGYAGLSGIVKMIHFEQTILEGRLE